MADITTDQNYQNVTIQIRDSRGLPAPVDGVPVWASSDETVLAVTPSSDGMSALVDTVAPGTARVSVTVDADRGAGIETVVGVSEDVNVTQGASSKASVITFDFGTPVDKPSPSS